VSNATFVVDFVEDSAGSSCMQLDDLCDSKTLPVIWKLCTLMGYSSTFN
jgi:hypothetical protein